MIGLIYDSGDKQYGYLDSSCVCGKCEASINVGDSFFIHRHSSGSVLKKAFYCMNYIKHYRRDIYNEFIPVVRLDSLPAHYRLIPDLPPALSNASCVSVFSAAVSNEGIKSDASECVINDHTRLAGRESWAGASVGCRVAAKPEIGLEDVDRYVSGLGVPVLPNGEPIPKQLLRRVVE